MAEENKRTPDQTAAAAWDRVQQFLVYEAGEDERSQDWSADNLPEGAMNPLDPVGLDIYDLSGELIFRDHACPLQNGKEMRVSAATGPEQGVDVIKLAITPQPFPIEQWLSQANAKAAANALTPEAMPKALVCYSYPRLGLLCRDAAGAQHVIDLSDQNIVPVESDAPEAGEGAPQVASALTGEAPPPGPAPDVSPAGDVQQTVLSAVTLVPQATPTYCAVASAKMILGFHDFVKTQDQIALVFNTGPGGTMPAAQIAGYPVLSNQELVAADATPVAFDVVVTEVNAQRPLKSGIPGHARVACGWKTDSSTTPVGQWIYVQDPWPTNQGQTYWESWTAVRHTNLMSVKSADPGAPGGG